MTPELPEGGGRVRLGAVGYLNARPLVHGLDADPRFALRFDVPAVCAQLLHQGAIDFGLIPAIESAREPDYAIVRDAAVASFGPVDSVAIYTQNPLEQVTTLALDTSSRTSAALVRVLCRFHFGIAPTFQSVGPDIRDMLQRCDAALLIGDPALFLDPASLGVEKIDLGEQWFGPARGARQRGVDHDHQGREGQVHHRLERFLLGRLVLAGNCGRWILGRQQSGCAQDGNEQRGQCESDGSDGLHDSADAGLASPAAHEDDHRQYKDRAGTKHKDGRRWE